MRNVGTVTLWMSKPARGPRGEHTEVVSVEGETGSSEAACRAQHVGAPRNDETPILTSGGGIREA